MKNTIIIFGGVHIDILADYDIKDKSRTDRVGELHYSIGGTAFNIAHYLSTNNKSVFLFSVLNKNSYSTLWIFREIRQTKIKPLFQIDHSTYSENGFVAIRQNGNLEAAVTASYLSKAELKPHLLNRFCKGKSLAVIDCNFESHQLLTIVKYCKKNKLKIIIAATSDSKVKRILPLLDSYPIDVVTMNELEACTLFNVKKYNDVTPEMISANIRNLIITLGAKGYVIFSNGIKSCYPAPYVSEVISTSGAGDALAAAVASCIAETDTISWTQCNQVINEFVGEALTHKGTYLKPTRKKISYKIFVIWGATFSFCALASIYCFMLNKFDLALYLTILSLIIAFAQIIRTEMRE